VLSSSETVLKIGLRFDKVRTEYRVALFYVHGVLYS